MICMTALGSASSGGSWLQTRHIGRIMAYLKSLSFACLGKYDGEPWNPIGPRARGQFRQRGVRTRAPRRAIKPLSTFCNGAPAVAHGRHMAARLRLLLDNCCVLLAGRFKGAAVTRRSSAAHSLQHWQTMLLRQTNTAPLERVAAQPAEDFGRRPPAVLRGCSNLRRRPLTLRLCAVRLDEKGKGFDSSFGRVSTRSSPPAHPPRPGACEPPGSRAGPNTDSLKLRGQPRPKVGPARDLSCYLYITSESSGAAAS